MRERSSFCSDARRTFVRGEKKSNNFRKKNLKRQFRSSAIKTLNREQQTNKTFGFVLFFSRRHRRHLSWQLCSKKTIKVYKAVNTAFFAVTRKSFSSFLVHFFTMRRFFLSILFLAISALGKFFFAAIFNFQTGKVPPKDRKSFGLDPNFFA